MTLHVVGLDLSLTGTGVTVARPGQAPHLQRIGTSTVDNEDYLVVHERIRTMTKRILRAADTGYEDGDRRLYLIEKPAYSSSTGQAHTRAGMWWMVYHLGRLMQGAEFVTVDIAHLKQYATGKGNTKKVGMVAAAVRAFPDLFVDDDNLADSTFLAAMGMRELGHPMDVTQRVFPAFLDKVHFPAWVAQHRVDLNSRPDRLVGDTE